MKRAAFPLAILAALVSGFGAHALISEARAQTPPATAVCEVINMPVGPGNKAATWMNEQIAAGRTRFVTAGATFCAW